MKNETIEQQILLRESGELSEAAAAQLDALIANTPEWMGYAKDANALQAIAQEALSVDGPAPEVVESVLAQAQGLNIDLKPRPFALRAVQVLSYAAALVLALGLWRFNLDVQRTDRISEMSAMLTFAGEAEGAAVLTGDSGDSLEALADMLLEMEGMVLDADDGLSEGDDWFMLPEEHPPTAIQGNNNRAFPAKRYG